MARAIESDRLYVMDRGYAKFTLFNQIVAAKSSYVCRLRDNSVWETVEARYRNDNAQINEVISDEIVRFSKSKPGSCPDHLVRVVCVRVNPHTTRGKSRSGSTGVDSDGILRIATNLTDVPFDIVSLLFAKRWAIETFIACMLISLWTGKKPTLRTYEMICFYFCGLADEDELQSHIQKLKPQAA